MSSQPDALGLRLHQQLPKPPPKPQNSQLMNPWCCCSFHIRGRRLLIFLCLLDIIFSSINLGHTNSYIKFWVFLSFLMITLSSFVIYLFQDRTHSCFQKFYSVLRLFMSLLNFLSLVSAFIRIFNILQRPMFQNKEQKHITYVSLALLVFLTILVVDLQWSVCLIHYLYCFQQKSQGFKGFGGHGNQMDDSAL